MLDLYTILWVIPGVIFTEIYNRRRPERAISVSGWQYVFYLVVIASITWIPAEFIAEEVFEWFKKCDVVYLFFNCLNEILDLDENKVQKMKILLISIVLTFLWLLLFQWGAIVRMIFPPVHDNFYNRSVEWENEEILLTLQNGKAYHGILWKYPENPKGRHESQTISIIPLKSGHRNNETKIVKWDTYYPEYKGFSHFIDMEVIIPRSEIITFGKFSFETFKHFETQQRHQGDGV